MFDAFQQAAQAIFQSALAEGRLHRNPGSDDLKAMALEEPEVGKTKYGSIFADSEPMSRAAKMTRNNVDSRFGDAERALLEQAQRRWPARNWWPSRWMSATAARGPPPG